MPNAIRTRHSALRYWLRVGPCSRRCHLIDRDVLLNPDCGKIEQVTKRPNIGNLKPMISSVPPQVPQGVSECDYLGISFSLTAQMSKQGSTNSDRPGQGRHEGDAGTPESATTRTTGTFLPSHWARWESRSGVGQSRLVKGDLVNSDAEAEQVKPVLLALAKAAAPKMK